MTTYIFAHLWRCGDGRILVDQVPADTPLEAAQEFMTMYGCRIPGYKHQELADRVSHCVAGYSDFQHVRDSLQDTLRTIIWFRYVTMVKAKL